MMCYVARPDPIDFAIFRVGALRFAHPISRPDLDFLLLDLIGTDR